MECVVLILETFLGPKVRLSKGKVEPLDPWLAKGASWFQADNIIELKKYIFVSIFLAGFQKTHLSRRYSEAKIDVGITSRDPDARLRQGCLFTPQLSLTSRLSFRSPSVRHAHLPLSSLRSCEYMRVRTRE